MPSWIRIAPLVALLLGCGAHRALPQVARCERVEAGPFIAPAEPRHEVHPDYEELRAYRHYFALRRVDAYAHHFTVYYHCDEPAEGNYAVFEDGRIEGASGGWPSSPPRDPPPVPADMKGFADRVLAQFKAGYRGEVGAMVVYQGSYRELVVDEIIPLDPPGVPYRQRRAMTLRVTFKADRTLSQLTPSRPERGLGGTSDLCSRVVARGDCSTPWWIDFGAAPSTGAFLESVLGKNAVDSEFARVLLQSARAREAGDEGPRLERLVVHHGDALLPPRFTPPVVVTFRLLTRAKENGGDEPHGELRIEISLKDALFGKAQGTATTTVGGVTLQGTATLSAVRPPPPDVAGTVDVTFRLAYELRDPRGTRRRAELPINGVLLVDGASVAARDLEISRTVPDGTHDPPRAQRFPGTSAFSALDAYLGVAPRPAFWVPR